MTAVTTFPDPFGPQGLSLRRTISPDISGAIGRFRAKTTTTNLTCATDDLEAANVYLAEWRNSPRTQRSYRKEVERLLLWAILVRKKAISSLDRQDYVAYERFLYAPPSEWCGVRRARRMPDGSPNVEWRPFVGPLSRAAGALALRIVNAFLGYLVEAGYLVANPLSLRRQRRANAIGDHDQVTRVLDPLEQRIIWRALHRRRKLTDHQRLVYERRRWALILFYGTGLRLSEAAFHTMGDFVEVHGKWRLRVVRKGAKPSWIPISPEVLDALRRYRLSLGLPPLPLPSEETPLIPALHTPTPIAARTVYQIIKTLFRNAAVIAAHRFPHKAAKLAQASTHWLRHSAITDLDAAGVPLTVLQRFADHADPSTTSRYVHTRDEHLYDAVANHRISKRALSDIAAAALGHHQP